MATKKKPLTNPEPIKRAVRLEMQKKRSRKSPPEVVDDPVEMESYITPYNDESGCQCADCTRMMD